ncbi:restriction endonuclease [Pelagerythrobacter sp.]|uniref:restriction endonuclease n=1 Tax=Pelagerythrobacter sp. TaxID=2800702 RepID=UPI0035B44744
MWKVNAGRRSALADDFIERNVVAIGWREAGDYSDARSYDEVYKLISAASPEQTEKQKQVSSGQIWRFLTEVSIGDSILTYAPETRLYHIGVVKGSPIFRPREIPALPVQRSVEWKSSVSRDDLSQAARGRLGAILTLFKVAHSAVVELEALAEGGHVHAQPNTDEALALDDASDPFESLEEQAIERVKDRLLRLDWDEMQQIVASLLRALGYRTQISPAGPDRGKDIIASRDGFGFERPRIVVEVKHRRDQMGAQEIRSFLGGRHQDDRGLYVSTGGFSRDAHYEAERASTVTHLMTLDELAHALIEQYDQIDEDGRRLLPLTKIYWPA